MATVPGVPDHTIPNTFAPTQADMLMAAAIMHRQGKFDPETPASDVESKPPNAKDWIRERQIEEKKHENLKEFFDPHNVETPIVPGTKVPDPERGGTKRRDVRAV